MDTMTAKLTIEGFGTGDLLIVIEGAAARGHTAPNFRRLKR